MPTTDYISKINVNDSVYNLKDLEARDLLGTSAVIESTTAPENTTKIWKVTGQNTYKYYAGSSLGWVTLSTGGGGGGSITVDDYLTEDEIADIIDTDIFWDGTVEDAD